MPMMISSILHTFRELLKRLHRLFSPIRGRKLDFISNIMYISIELFYHYGITNRRMLDILPILFFIAILLCFSAFFSGSETAMMSLSKPQIKRMEHGEGAEPLVFRLLKDQQHLIATILVGNMFVNT